MVELAGGLYEKYLSLRLVDMIKYYGSSREGWEEKYHDGGRVVGDHPARILTKPAPS